MTWDRDVAMLFTARPGSFIQYFCHSSIFIFTRDGESGRGVLLSYMESRGSNIQFGKRVYNFHSEKELK